jgi:copper chaperone
MVALKVEGMTCTHCSAAVKRALEAVAGVQSVDVNLAQGRAEVVGDADPGSLLAAVVEEGYSGTILTT